ncbi:MAG: dTDP-4-dehydrorhamnose reductase [Spirochaetae bacterium HGW-Spirochaetae-3]|jgi:dTDP-4-dehydrorhamnose reductase|nr:MAG: dTDP-4-dehydrorhamnose reductase [Spirochaetae bacterium HGW-Spirochaetae-3]
MIWLIGYKGMLGAELSEVLTAAGLEWSGSDREVDIRDLDALRSWLVAPGGGNGRKLDWIVNCSAYTAVDRAEDEEALARSINATGAGNIAMVANESGARLIHLSTDYVFRGDGTRPYVETDPVDPAGAYGRTKAEGENLVSNYCSRSLILRTAWLYGRHGPNFVRTMLKLMRERESISVVADQYGSPTWAFDLAQTILTIIKAEQIEYGIYHYTDAGQTSWFGFAVAIQALGRELGLLYRECEVKAISSEQYPARVKRPLWSVLSKDKIDAAFGIKPPEWKESLRKYLESENGMVQS